MVALGASPRDLSAGGHTRRVLIAVSGDGAGGGWLAPVWPTAGGGPVRRVDDLAAAVADHEAARAVRWLRASTAAV